MPRKHFSGITTVEDLRLRCIVDEITGCWLWKGATSHDKRGKPMQRLWVFDAAADKFRTMSGPTAVLELSNRRGAGVKLGWRTCACETCMNPDHIVGGTRAQWGAWVVAQGAWKNLQSKVAANRKSVRRRARITLDIAREIRASALSAKELAEQHNIVPKYVSQIRRNQAWQEVTPWQGLGAR